MSGVIRATTQSGTVYLISNESVDILQYGNLIDSIPYPYMLRVFDSEYAQELLDMGGVYLLRRIIESSTPVPGDVPQVGLSIYVAHSARRSSNWRLSTPVVSVDFLE